MKAAGLRSGARRFGPAAAALAGGAAAALAHPPFGVLPAVFGYGLILWALQRPARGRWGSGLRRGWAAGVGYFGVSTLWIAEPFLIDAQAHAWQIPFAMAGLAGGLGLLWGLGGLLFRLSTARPGGGPAAALFAFAAAFSLAEWLRGHLLTGFPWDLPGETFRAGSALSQGAALVGAYGMTPVVLLVGAAPVLWAGGPAAWRSRTAALAGVALLVGGLGSWGAVRLERPPAPTGLHLRVVQPDLPEPPAWSPAVLQRALDRYTALTSAPPADGRPPPGLVVWPEGALPASLNETLDPQGPPATALARALRPGQTLLLGGARAEAPGPGGRWFNTLVALRRAPTGLRVEGLYDKHRLVPFGEYLPLAPLLGRLGLRKLISVPADFSPGPPPRPLRLAGGPLVQPLICYEALFPGLARDGGERPSLLVNISDDAWFGRDMGPWQHLNLASYRAIEAGLPMVRATPTGVSAVIDAYGRPVALLPPGRAGVLDVEAPAPTTAWATSSAVHAAAFWLIIVLLTALSTCRGRDIARMTRRTS